MAYKTLIIGASGNLGTQLIKDFPKDFEVVGTYYQNQKSNMIRLDITDKKEINDVFNKTNPNMVILASAMTNVEACESEVKKAMEINYSGVGHIVQKCDNRKLVFYSTDFIFNGLKKEYKEEDMPSPLNIYGKSKVMAEEIVNKLSDYLIIRTSRLYNKKGNKFVNKIIASLKNKEEVKAPSNTKGNMSFIPDVSQATLDLIKKNVKGIYHVAGEPLSFDEAAYKIANFFNFDKSLITSVDKDFFNTNVNRPSVVLNTDKAVKQGIKIHSLEETLKELSD